MSFEIVVTPTGTFEFIQLHATNEIDYKQIATLGEKQIMEMLKQQHAGALAEAILERSLGEQRVEYDAARQCHIIRTTIRVARRQ